VLVIPEFVGGGERNVDVILEQRRSSFIELCACRCVEFVDPLRRCLASNHAPLYVSNRSMSYN